MIQGLTKIPFWLFVLGFAAWLGYGLYQFEFAADGAHEMHIAQVAAIQAEINTIKEKIVQAEDFFKKLEAKKQDLKLLMVRLSELQATLSESLEVPALVNLLVTESNAVGIRIEKIEPGEVTKKDFTIEREFKLSVRGTYAQIVYFLEKLANVRRIIRVEGFDLKPRNPSTSKYIITEANLSVRAYQYALDKADEILKGAKP
jgi:Tfp pilus assembly protein PilO